VEHPANQAPNGFDKINAVIAGLVALIAFIIYRLTVAPTFSYWDCGEFIACAHILGNPHPPGSPLFILVGRFFDILPIGANVAFRINLVSVVSSMFTAMFAYLITVRLVTSWYAGRAEYREGRLIAYASGIIGALFMAFCQTNWNNSVEAEVYGLAMLVMMAVFWLGLKWFDHRYSPAGQRIILLAVFLTFLTVGAHLTVFLILPIVAIFFSLNKDATKSDWALVAGFFALELLLIFLLAGSFANYKIFLAFTALSFAAMAFYLRNKIHWPILLSLAAVSTIMIAFYPFLAGLLIWFFVSAVVWSITRKPQWLLAMLIMIMAAAGFSVHAFIPIRSTHHPIIDENTPSRSFTTFVDFLDRKQYGNMSMTERMFVRRGSWENQFGDHSRMGFLRFFKGQYSNKSLFPLFFLIGIGGMIMLAVKNPAWGSVFITFFLVSSVGLILYMNFADGTRYNEMTGDAYQEVRDRDYFFTPAFILFGMAIGLGMGAAMETIRKASEKYGPDLNRKAVIASMILVLTPIIPAKANYFANDRSSNYMAYAYAYNILSSCDKNGILFTSGDNDTFPIWCIQEAYNFRKDVRVVNFSLLNTDWYTWQLSNLDLLSAINSGYDLDSLGRVARSSLAAGKATKLEEPSEFLGSETDQYVREYLDSLAKQNRLPAGIRERAPISLTDDQILWIDTVMQGQTVVRPAKPFYDPVRKRANYLYPTIYDGEALKVSTMMMENIILNNKWRYPIYFSSVSGNVRESPLNLSDRMYREGMVVRLTPDIVKMAYNVPRSDSLFFKVYDYRNLSDTNVAQDENAAGISLTYPEKLLDYQQYISTSPDSGRADALLDRICKTIPAYWRARLWQRDMYTRRGDSATAKQIENEMMTYLRGFLDKNPENIFFMQFVGMAEYAIGDKTSAEEYLSQAWELNHDNEHVFRALLTLYAEMRRPGDMLRVAETYKQYQARDPIANDVIRNAQALMQGQSRPPAQAPPVQMVPPQPTQPRPESGG